jgi:hypothetical protein
MLLPTSLVACGSSSDTNLYFRRGSGGADAGLQDGSRVITGTGGSGGAPQTGAGTGGRSDSGGVGGTSSGGGRGAAITDAEASDANAGGASGSGGVSATVGSGGSGGVRATGGTVGTGGAVGTGGMGGTIACQQAACDVGSRQTCCFGDGVTPHCFGGNLGGQCNCVGIICTSIVVECDGPEDCPSGQLCCGEEGITDSVFTHLYCRNGCPGGTTVTRTEICHPGGVACKNGNQCNSDNQLPNGYSDCG